MPSRSDVCCESSRTLGALRVLLDSMAIPAVIVSQNGNVLLANCRARSFFAADGAGTGSKEVVRLHPADQWEIVPLRPDRPEPYFLAILPTRREPAAALPHAVRLACASWRLTARQQAVLELLTAGHTNDAIADQLDIETGTVEFHVGRLFDKAGVSSRAALIARVVEVATR